ncbi:hypothetical protein Tco_1091391 [Tanacetum coccineum]|uniref:Gag-Pol polyprotein n=1 Tax=Tanacetum coccineum TaxID=301880 RepID=A0ABQ5I916_9ASTR
MNPVAAQQVALDNVLVAPEKRLKIEKCNMRIEFNKLQREPTYQVTLDVLKLSPCYPAFLITAEVPEIYMHQFWNTIKKIKDTDAYQFKLDKKKFRINTKVFREILQISKDMWVAIERLQQGESLNKQDVKTNLFWKFGRFTSRDGESIESYYSRFYKIMNEMMRNQLEVATMEVNVQSLQQLQPEWSRFVTIV